MCYLNKREKPQYSSSKYCRNRSKILIESSQALNGVVKAYGRGGGGGGERIIFTKTIFLSDNQKVFPC